MIAALDPGRDKCGFAVLEENGSILQQRVIETSCLEQEIDTALAKYTIDVLVKGHGTTSQQARQRIEKACPQLRLLVVDEYRTTELAKKAYWKAKPPRGTPHRSLHPLNSASSAPIHTILLIAVCA